HKMAWYEIGQGPTLLCLHGSYDHLLYRPMAELFAPKYRCVLYDQRGCGQSRFKVLNEESMHINRFVSDIEVLRNHLGLEKVALLGHSWGCALGLLYSQAFPNRVSHLILAGPGPLSDEMWAFYDANEERMMDPADRSKASQIAQAYQRARASGRGVPREIDEANIRMWAPVMFYSRDEADRFVDKYLEAGGYRRHAQGAQGFKREMQLAQAHKISAPTLVLYGYQDYEPITQAYLIKEKIPQTQIEFLNRCGHMAWLEQPGAFFESINAFVHSVGLPAEDAHESSLREETT
ncbi:alpha/beta hydrolase, partial [Candidatus Poribacteria bacterium]|nr:alpha/beta hydrolase [Candidatus Poribacteria bacterium]